MSSAARASARSCWLASYARAPGAWSRSSTTARGRRACRALSPPRASPRLRALAALEPHPLALNGLHWYAQHALPSLPPRIDLLLVDGPPAFEPHIELSRYPALPALAERLVPDATVILDDIDRPGELRILETWERDCDFRFEVRPAQRIAIGHRS